MFARLCDNTCTCRGRFSGLFFSGYFSVEGVFMTDVVRTEMPRAWEDADRWERYYADLSEEERREKAGEARGMGVDRVRAIAGDMRRLAGRMCGYPVWMFVRGWMFAMCGMKVTDVSATAAFQQSQAVREGASAAVGDSGGDVERCRGEGECFRRKEDGRRCRNGSRNLDSERC